MENTPKNNGNGTVLDRQNREYLIKCLFEEAARLNEEGKTLESCSKFSEAIKLAIETY